MRINKKLHLFCRIVDNFGDIGVCWRLARQLADEYAIDITLWVDDLNSFHKICNTIDPQLDFQRVNSVAVHRWPEDFIDEIEHEPADIVIEGFGCDLPNLYLQKMALSAPAPLWINLEYLSAEPWVEGCHKLASRHPQLPLTRYFFFPGFTAMTGGLLAENGLSSRRRLFQDDVQAGATFLSSLGVEPEESALKVSLFCYPDAPLSALFDAIQTDGRRVQCLVPEGIALDAIRKFFDCTPIAGTCVRRGPLSVHVVPFLEQSDYDKLLWTCDLNFVRGEDSFVRAQWAGRPFVWQIYPQEEGAHWKKLHAFLNLYLLNTTTDTSSSLNNIWETWNGKGNFSSQWSMLRAVLPKLDAHAETWSGRLTENGDLAANLVQFIKHFSI